MNRAYLRRTPWLINFIGALAVLTSGCQPAAPDPGQVARDGAEASAVVQSANATNTALAGVAQKKATVLARTPTAAAATRTPRATATPVSVVAKLPRGYERFTSAVHPYSIGYPDGWRAVGDAFRVGNISGDIFLDERVSGGRVSINVLADDVSDAEDVQLAQYVDAVIAQIKKSRGQTVQRAGTARAGKQRAALLVFSDAGTDYTQAVWLSNGRGWVATLGTPRGQRKRYRPVLVTMLRTLQTGAQPDVEPDSAEL
ncbi:MAG: hypothetical protein M3506_10645 [Chloroflexota bacterium]|nr:hypothetical protein [Chloroflexota bacterium]